MTGPAFIFAGRNGTLTWVLRAAALGEYIVDKLPGTPTRTQPVGLTARAIAAAFAGAAIANEGERTIGAVYAVAGALASAYLGVAYRNACAERNLPALPSALAEDALAMALAWSVRPRKRD